MPQQELDFLADRGHEACLLQPNTCRCVVASRMCRSVSRKQPVVQFHVRGKHALSRKAVDEHFTRALTHSTGQSAVGEKALNAVGKRGHVAWPDEESGLPVTNELPSICPERPSLAAFPPIVCRLPNMIQVCPLY